MSVISGIYTMGKRPSAPSTRPRPITPKELFGGDITHMRIGQCLVVSEPALINPYMARVGVLNAAHWERPKHPKSRKYKWALNSRNDTLRITRIK